MQLNSLKSKIKLPRSMPTESIPIRSYLLSENQIMMKKQGSKIIWTVSQKYILKVFLSIFLSLEPFTKL